MGGLDDARRSAGVLTRHLRFFLLATVAVMNAVGVAPAFAGGRNDAIAVARLAPWNAPDPFGRKAGEITSKSCTSPTGLQKGGALASRGPTRWRR